MHTSTMDEKKTKQHAIENRLGSLCLGCLVLLTLACTVPSALAGAPAGQDIDTCDSGRIVIDYLRPFKSMPPASPPPVSGRLPFAPRDLYLEPFASNRVLAGGGHFGYVFGTRNAPLADLNLRWLAIVRLETINKKGARQRSVTVQRRRLAKVNSLAELDFTLTLTPSPALYRYHLEFRRLSGHLLARYDQYVRVVRRKVRASIHTDSIQARPGEGIDLQLVNEGTEAIDYGEGGLVSFWNGENWVAAFKINSRGNKQAFVLEAGRAGRCESLEIPSHAPSGRYRIQKRISTRTWPSKRLITAPMEVIRH